jgi:hypothetical protein
MTEITRPPSALVGARRGAIVLQQRTTPGLAERLRNASDQPSRSNEPHRPITKSSFASREPDSVTETGACDFVWSNPFDTPGYVATPASLLALAESG